MLHPGGVKYSPCSESCSLVLLNSFVSSPGCSLVFSPSSFTPSPPCTLLPHSPSSLTPLPPSSPHPVLPHSPSSLTPSTPHPLSLPHPSPPPSLPPPLLPQLCGMDTVGLTVSIVSPVEVQAREKYQNMKKSKCGAQTKGELVLKEEDGKS